MANVAMRTVTVTIDADLVEEIEAAGDDLSARVTEALGSDMVTRRRQRALGEVLDRLDDERGPLDTPEDEAEIQRFMRLLGGSPAPAIEGPSRLASPYRNVMIQGLDER
jgi:hypothetical protein